MLARRVRLARRDRRARATRPGHRCPRRVRHQPWLRLLRRGAGENGVAGLERVVLRQKRDLLRHAPDHLVDVGLLAELAIHLEPELALRTGDQFCWPAWPARKARPGRSPCRSSTDGPCPFPVAAGRAGSCPGRSRSPRRARWRERRRSCSHPLPISATISRFPMVVAAHRRIVESRRSHRRRPAPDHAALCRKKNGCSRPSPPISFWCST